MMPYAGKSFKVCRTIFCIVLVLPETHRHGWEWLATDQLALGSIRDFFAVIVEHRDIHRRPLHWISPRWTGKVGLPRTKQEIKSVPPEIEERQTSFLIAS